MSIKYFWLVNSEVEVDAKIIRVDLLENVVLKETEEEIEEIE